MVRLAHLLAVTVLTLSAGCGGGDSLPAGGTARDGEPAPSGDTRALTLSGVAVVPPYELRVRLEPTAEGPRYRVTVDALNWTVAFDVETWRLSGPVVGASLTSASDVPGGGLVLRSLWVNGARLGTSGTAALDRCDGDDDDRRSSNRQGLVSGRFTRLDTVARGTFVVAGTDDRCRRLDGSVIFATLVE